MFIYLACAEAYYPCTMIFIITTQVLKVYRTPGPTAYLKLLYEVCLKSCRTEKKSIPQLHFPQTMYCRYSVYNVM